MFLVHPHQKAVLLRAFVTAAHTFGQTDAIPAISAVHQVHVVLTRLQRQPRQDHMMRRAAQRPPARSSFEQIAAVVSALDVRHAPSDGRTARARSHDLIANLNGFNRLAARSGQHSSSRRQALVWIADDQQIAVFFGQQARHLVLRFVGVLILVHVNKQRPRLDFLENLPVFSEQLHGQRQQIPEVNRVDAPHRALVTPIAFHGDISRHPRHPLVAFPC